MTYTESMTALSPNPASATAPIDPKKAYPRLRPLIEYLDGLNGRADLDLLGELLTNLKLSRADIEAACIFGARGYRRNTISRSDHYELLALCWRSGHCTPIHDHKGVSCAFKVIHGTGTETRFRITDSEQIAPVGSVDMAPGYLCAARDEDIHQVANFQSPGKDLVTLHIYSPPIKSMNVFHAAKPADSPEVYRPVNDMDDWSV